MFTCHHQMISRKCTADMQNIDVCMHVCVRNVNIHVTVKQCSLGAQMFPPVLVQRL